MGELVHAAEMFKVDYAPQTAGERPTWGCIDERTMLLAGLCKKLNYHYADEEHVVELFNRREGTDSRHFDHLYSQTAGGAGGAGQDAHIAMRMSGKYPDNVIAPAHLFTSSLTGVARTEGIDLLTHEGCAAEANAPLIAEGIATNCGPQGENIFEAIRSMKPGGLSRDRFDQVAHTYGKALVQGAFIPAEKATNFYDNGQSPHLPAIARGPLIDIGHFADAHLIDWEPGTAYDTAAGLENSDLKAGISLGAYHTSMGNMPELADIAARRWGAEPEDFIDAAFIRNAATSLYLPRQHNVDTPTQLYMVGTA